jgi:hypothetical protein
MESCGLIRSAACRQHAISHHSLTSQHPVRIWHLTRATNAQAPQMSLYSKFPDLREESVARLLAACAQVRLASGASSSSA